MREDSCPELAVPGISRWLFTVRDKKILLFPFQFSFIHFSLHAMQKYVCCSSGYFILSMSSCLGLPLVLWKRNHGCRWRLVTAFTSSSICHCFSKAVLERTRQNLKALLPQTIVLQVLNQGKPREYSLHALQTHIFPSNLQQLENFPAKEAKPEVGIDSLQICLVNTESVSSIVLTEAWSCSHR